jgi:hypothetical protein
MIVSVNVVILLIVAATKRVMNAKRIKKTAKDNQ